MGSTPQPYQNGLFEDQVAPTIVLPQPDVTVKAISIQTGRRNSQIISARFQFVTANPNIEGDNAASFTISNITANAEMYWTTNGVDPTNVVSDSNFGPVYSGTALSFHLNGDLTFKIRAYHDNYSDSGVSSKIFSLSNFVPNHITFGFEGGEASSDFVGSPGQAFYAPVTLSTIAGAQMFSLQFNLTVDAPRSIRGPAITPGAFNFQSFLEKPDPGARRIIQYGFRRLMFAEYVNGTNYILPIESFRIPTACSSRQSGEQFLSLRFTNSINLLWDWLVERDGNLTNLYNTDETKPDYLLPAARHLIFITIPGRKIRSGGYSFVVPAMPRAASSIKSRSAARPRPRMASARPDPVFIDLPSTGS